VQSKKQSLIESVVNIIIGYCVAVISQLAVFPLVGINCSFTTNLQIGIYFTIIS